MVFGILKTSISIRNSSRAVEVEGITSNSEHKLKNIILYPFYRQGESQANYHRPTTKYHIEDRRNVDVEL